MVTPGHNLDDLLGSVLRGVNKIVGCNSTNLVVISEKTQQMRIQMGVRSDDYPVLSQLEEALGVSFRGLSVPLAAAHGGLLSQVWQDGTVRETSSLAEMVSKAIDPGVLSQFERMAGLRRYLVVPASGATRKYGVLLFEKPGQQPFTRQQREVLVRYARQIGDLIENDMKGHGAQLPPTGGEQRRVLLFDDQGQVCGQPEGFALPGDPLSGPVRAFLGSGGPAEVALPDGSRARFELYGLGQGTGVLCTLTRPADPGLSALGNQLLQLTLGAPAPALFVDPDFQITSTNPAAERILDRDDSALVGHHLSEFFAEPAEIAELLGRQALFPEHPVAEVKAILITPERVMRPVQVELLLLVDGDDRTVGYLLLLRPDASQDRVTTHRLLQQERLATMGEMAAQLAHEIRNPLVAIGATLESLGLDTRDGRQRDLLQSAIEEIGRLDMILRTYLAGRHDMTFATFHLAGLFEDVRRLLTGARKLSGKRVSIVVDPDLEIAADYDALKHVVFNLVLNALEAAPPGSEVICRAERGPRAISLAVEDEGPGLTAPAHDCLQPFFTTKSNGTGLGLPVCLKVIQSHGGTLDIGNRPEGGCRATVLLPIRELAGEQ